MLFVARFVFSFFVFLLFCANIYVALAFFLLGLIGLALHSFVFLSFVSFACYRSRCLHLLFAFFFTGICTYCMHILYVHIK